MDARALALEELLVHAAWVRRLARSLTQDEARAEDATQDAFEAALERPPVRTANLRGWLARVLTNAARSRGRAESRRARRERAGARPEALPSAAELAGEAWQWTPGDVDLEARPRLAMARQIWIRGRIADEFGASIERDWLYPEYEEPHISRTGIAWSTCPSPSRSRPVATTSTTSSGETNGRSERSRDAFAAQAAVSPRTPSSR
jgi:hypothetical protein